MKNHQVVFHSILFTSTFNCHRGESSTAFFFCIFGWTLTHGGSQLPQNNQFPGIHLTLSFWGVSVLQNEVVFCTFLHLFLVECYGLAAFLALWTSCFSQRRSGYDWEGWWVPWRKSSQVLRRWYLGPSHLPIGSMHGIFTMVNIGKYTIHGAYELVSTYGYLVIPIHMPWKAIWKGNNPT